MSRGSAALDSREAWASVRAGALSLLKDWPDFASLSDSSRIAADGALYPKLVEKFDPSEPRDEHGRWTDGGGEGGGSEARPAEKPASAIPSAGAGRYGPASAAYDRRSPGSSEGGRGDLTSVHEPNDAGKAYFAAAGATPQTFHELNASGAQRFHDAISAAKQSSKFGASVHAYPAADYAHLRTFLTPDGKAGFALKDGDIVSAFKNNEKQADKFTIPALALATQEGGNRLDAFDTVLPRIYSDSGFRAVARLPFSDEYKPDGWNYQTFAKFNGDRPDVVFMIHDPEHAGPYKPGDGEKVSTYEEGVAAQMRALDALKGSKSWQAIKAQSLRLLQRIGPADEPRDETGKWTSGGGGSSTGEAEKPAAAKPAERPAVPAAKPGGGKKAATITDFAKDEVNLDGETRSNPEKQKKFIETWNKHVAEAPAEFRNQFLGGLKGTMQIHFNDKEDSLTVTGRLQDAHGSQIGEYTRNIDFPQNKAFSSYFKLNGSKQHAGVGKTLLAANVAMYQKMGLSAVEVHADIDVGGYAWAKYGYVPTDSSWRVLSGEIEGKVDAMAGGAGGYASSWEDLSSGRQAQIESAFMQSTRDEFLDSEIESWRDGGQPLEDAKNDLASDFSSKSDWAKEAVAGYGSKREEQGKPDFPFTDQQILDAISISYSSRYQDGRGDPDITFDDEKLTEPEGYDPAQQTLPGIPVIEPHERLTEEMRDGLTSALERAFNREAESKASDAEPPNYLSESAQEQQGEYWDQLDDEEKYRWAKRNERDLIEGGSEPTDQMDEADADRLRTLAQSDDPKALWLIADSKYGKDLLLGTDWNGFIDMRDKQTMDRFNAYVGKAKAGA